MKDVVLKNSSAKYELISELKSLRRDILERELKLIFTKERRTCEKSIAILDSKLRALRYKREQINNVLCMLEMFNSFRLEHKITAQHLLGRSGVNYN